MNWFLKIWRAVRLDLILLYWLVGILIFRFQYSSFTIQVFPALREHAKKNMEPGVVPVVLTTCNIEKNLCTHYVVSKIFNFVQLFHAP